jgi:hypothetical protein
MVIATISSIRLKPRVNARRVDAGFMAEMSRSG